jgi:hypothetical protein
MYKSRPPSNPNGPDRAYLSQMDSRASTRSKYTGPDQNIFGVDVRSVLGKAFFHADNIQIIRSDLYSTAVETLKRTIPRSDIQWPNDTLIYKKCHEFYPIYAPTVHSLDSSTLPTQIRQLNKKIVESILPVYISEIKGNRYYIQSLDGVPNRAELPAYAENATHKENTNRTVLMSTTPHPVVSQGDSFTKDQYKHIVHPIPHNPWLAARLPELFTLSTTNSTL